jgi:predicted dehydrogenase
VTRPLRVGVIGAGSWSNAVYLPYLASRDDVETVVVARRNGDLARSIAARFGIPNATDSWEEALRLGLDAVIVSSPPAAHEAQVIGALESGAHVLCEKPFAITSSAAWHMVEASRRTGRALVVALGWNYTTLAAAARQLLVDRKIGDVEFLTLEIRVATRELLSGRSGYNLASSAIPPQPETFIVSEVSGGGMAPVTMSHAIGLALYLSRLEPREVYGRVWNGPAGVDLHDAMIVTFEGGGLGAINGASSHECKAAVEWSIGIFGSGGQLQLDSILPDVHFGSVDGTLYRADLAADASSYVPTAPLRELIEVAQGGSPSDRGAAELGARTVELVEASYRSDSERRPVPVPSPSRPVDALRWPSEGR